MRSLREARLRVSGETVVDAADCQRIRSGQKMLILVVVFTFH